MVFPCSVGYPCPEMFNPADHYVHVLAVTPGEEDQCRKRIDMICNNFAESADGEIQFWSRKDLRLNFIYQILLQAGLLFSRSNTRELTHTTCQGWRVSSRKRVRTGKNNDSLSCTISTIISSNPGGGTCS